MDQLGELPLGIISISNVTTTSIHFFTQPVKFVVGIADGGTVRIGRCFQIAACAGGCACVIIVGIGRERSAADFGRGGLTPVIVSKIVILVLLRTRAEGLAVKDRQPAVRIAVADVGDPVAIGILGAERGGVVGVVRALILRICD